MGKLSVYKQSFRNALNPGEILKVSEWADKYRRLSDVSSAEPGPWRTSRTPYLKEIMDCLSDHSRIKEVIFMKGAQVGAALSHCTLLPTPDGWTNMGDVKVGDEVFDEDGNSCNVNFKSETFINHQCYEVTFFDGSKITADASHRWYVRDQKSKASNKYKILTTQEMLDDGVVFRGNRSRWCVQLNQPIKCNYKKLPIDPWVLGYWLGDGHKNQRRVTCDKKDQIELMGMFDYCGHPAQLVHEVQLRGNGVTFSFGEKFEMKKFKSIGVKGNKHIPKSYLRASVNQRISLLQGLMDSDGSISNNRREFSTRDNNILLGVKELLSSLGVKYSVYSMLEKKKYDKSGNEMATTHRVSFTTFAIDCFRLRRKHYRQKDVGRIKETKRRYITSIKKVRSVPVSCIQVDSPSHLYLCSENMIPTHNTEAGLNWLGYIIDHSPGPTLMVQPTDTMVRRVSKQRIDPLIETSPTLSKKIKSKRSRDAGNTVNQKDFKGGTLILAGANSAAGLRSMPARYLFLDEVDGYPGDVDGEGDPITLAMARQRTFAKRKTFIVSTPTIAGLSKIEPKFEESDQRFFEVPCPHCDYYQKLKFSNLIYKKTEIENTSYRCDNDDCGVLIEEYNKPKMLANGRWVAKNPSSKIAGFHLSSLYSPLGWYSWANIVSDWLESKDNREKLRGFINTVLGETWKDRGEAPDYDRLYERRENYKTNVIPKEAGSGFLTAAVDVQKDRLEVEIVYWTRRLVSWSIDYRVLDGDTSLDAVWEELEDTLYEVFPLEGTNKGIKIKKLGVDSGYRTQRVYSWVRTQDQSRVVAVKGQDNLPSPMGLPKFVDVNYRGKKVRRGLKYWPVGTNVCKNELYSFLKLSKAKYKERDPRGYCHFPEYEENFFKMLTAEELVIKKIKGYSKSEWIKVRERNEALDTRVYNRALASMVGIDRYKESHWERLDKELGFLENQDKETKAPQKEHNRKQNNKDVEVVKKKKRQITRRDSSYWN